MSIIAKDMATEVCSIYVRRAGDVLELFATQGLRATAVRRTRLGIGEGLIGEIAAKAGHWRFPTRRTIRASSISRKRERKFIIP